MSNFQINDLEVAIQELNSDELKKLEGGSVFGFASAVSDGEVNITGAGIQGGNGLLADESVNTGAFFGLGAQTILNN